MSSIAAITKAREAEGYMTAEQAKELKIDDELEYPVGWPTAGNLELARPVKIVNLARSSWSQTHVLVGLVCANGKTTQVDAGWFKPPARMIAQNDDDLW